MQPIFEMMRTWTPFGQGLFMLIVLVLGCLAIESAMASFVAILRGHPPARPICACDEDEADEDE